MKYYSYSQSCAVEITKRLSFHYTHFTFNFNIQRTLQLKKFKEGVKETLNTYKHVCMSLFNTNDVQLWQVKEVVLLVGRKRICCRRKPLGLF